MSQPKLTTLDVPAAPNFCIGDKICVLKNVLASGAMMPAVGIEGKIVNLKKNFIVCQFVPPFTLADGGTALEDPNHAFVQVYYSAAEIALIPPLVPKFIHGEWDHIFAGDRKKTVQFVFQCETETIIAMQKKRGLGWRLATANEIADVQDSLLNANEFALMSEDAAGLHFSQTQPTWAIKQ